MDRYNVAILRAKKHLIKKSRDRSHNLEHHQDVWKTCKSIIQAEKLKTNEKLLKISAFWHDVVVGEKKWPSRLMVDETCVYLSKLLRELKFNDKERSNVVETIRHHEFRDTPSTLEGLILQDADKLDILSLDRWNRTLESYKRGVMKKETLSSYMRTFLKWSPILSATFHYKYSREIAQKSIQHHN